MELKTFIPLIGAFFLIAIALFIINAISQLSARNNAASESPPVFSILTASAALVGMIVGFIFLFLGWNFADSIKQTQFFTLGSIIITLFAGFFIQILAGLDQRNQDKLKTKKIMKELEDLKDTLDKFTKENSIEKTSVESKEVVNKSMNSTNNFSIRDIILPLSSLITILIFSRFSKVEKK